MKNPMLKVSIFLVALSVSAHGVCISDASQAKAAMASMSAAQLEKAGDECRAEKNYVQAVDYLREALRKDPKNAKLYNKLGMSELKDNQLANARADFLSAAKYDRKYAEAMNNIGAVYYMENNYGQAAKYFKKAVALDETHPSFHVNLGAAWFAQNQMDRAIREYRRALELDPQVLSHDSRMGIAAQITNPEERAKQDFMMARIYASMGNVDSCLVCLQKAKEDGYKSLDKVYTDEEFASIRHDTRLAQIVPPPAK